MRVVPREPRKLQVVTDVPERAMVVFAHPDDAEIGSGGVVAKWIAAGCEVTYVLCTNGDAGTTERSLTPAALAAQRAEEPRGAAQGPRALVLGRGRAGRHRRRHGVDRPPDRRARASREPDARLQRGDRGDDRRAPEEGRGRARGGLRVPVRRRVPAPGRAAVTT